jgi:fibronectin type 3 domain-containing protein
MAVTATADDGTVFVRDPLPQVERIAVMPFKAPSDAARALFTYLLLTELEAGRRYELVPPAEVAERIQVPEIALAALNEKQAVEVANLLGTDAVAVGTVSRFEQVDAGQGPVPVVELSLQLLECRSGQPVWRVARKATAASPSRRLSEHADAVVQEVLRALEEKLPPVPAGDPASQIVSRGRGPAGPARDAVGTGLNNIIDPAAPLTPTGLTVSETRLREVSLTWDRPPEPVHRYRVERAVTLEGPFELLAEVAPRRCFYRDHGERHAPLDDNRAYFYRLVAADREGRKSRPGAAVKAVTPPPPAPPTDLVATAPDARVIDLTWTASGAEDVVEYRVERAAASAPHSFIEVAAPGSTGYRDDGSRTGHLEDATKYLYRVRAVNRVGAIGPPSTVASAVTPPPPEPPVGLRATDESVRCVPLSWEVSPETNVVEYQVYRTESESGEFELLKVIGGRNNTRFVDGGGVPGNLQDAHTYYYVVRAVNRVRAQSQASAVVRATTRAVPPVVRNVSARSGEPRQVTLDWAPSPDDQVVGYEIWRAVEQNRNFVPIAKVTGRASTTYVDRGGTRRDEGLGLLLDGATYQYKVLAFNTADVQSDWSETASARTKPAPAGPAQVRSTTDQPEKAVLTWTTNPEVDIESYLVQSAARPDGPFARPHSVDAPPETATVSFEDTGLRHGETRFYRVKAIDADGLEGDWSEVVQGQAKPMPDRPRNVYAHQDDRSVRLSWDAPPQRDVREYRVWTRVLLSWELLDTTEGTDYALPAEALARRHVLSVSSVDDDGLESRRSDPVRTDAVRYR